MKVLNRELYRTVNHNPVFDGEVDDLLDQGMIEMAMANGEWWKIRRNGQTKRWKKDVNRIRIPIKFGWRGYGVIAEGDFVEV